MFELHNTKEAIRVSQCGLRRENRCTQRMTSKPNVIKVKNFKFKAEHHTEDSKEAEIIISKVPVDAMTDRKKATFDSDAKM